MSSKRRHQLTAAALASNAAAVAESSPCAAYASKRKRSCSSCGRTAEEVNFQPIKKAKKADAKQPSSGYMVQPDDACDKCFHFWKQYLNFFSWPAFSKTMKEGGTFTKEALAAMENVASGTSPSFARSSVDLVQRSGIFIKRRGFFLDREEFQQATNKTPEECKQQPIDGVNEHGERVRGYAVADPSHRWREFEAVGALEEVLSTQHLHPNDHWMPSQGTRLQKHLQDTRMKKGVRKLFQKGALQSIDEIIAAKAPDLASDESNGDDSDGDGNMEDQEARSGPAACSVAQGSPGAKTARLTDKPGDNPEGLAESVVHWKAKLSLAIVMSGKALGREKGFAREAIDRLASKKMKSDASHLEAHLQLVDKAENLTPKRIATISAEALHESITTLLGQEVDFPSTVKDAITERALTDLLGEAATGNEESSRKFLAAVSPCTVPGVHGEGELFDAMKPNVATCDGDPASKVGWFIRSALKGLVAKCVDAGEHGKTTLQFVCKSWTDMYERDFGEGTHEVFETFLCDVLQCARVTLALFDFAKCEEDAADVIDMLGPKANIHGLKRVMKDTLVNGEKSKERIQACLDYCGSSVLLSTKVRQVPVLMEALAAESANADSLADMVATLLTGKTTLKYHDLSATIQRVLAVMEKFFPVCSAPGSDSKHMQSFIDASRNMATIDPAAAVKLNTMINTIGEAMRAQASESRVAALVVACNSLADKLKDGTFAENDGHLKDLRAALASGRGLRVGSDVVEARAAVVRAASAILRKCCSEVVASDVGILTIVGDLASKLPEYDADAKAIAESVVVISGTWEMQEAKRRFVDLGADVATRMSADADFRIVQSLRRTRQAIEEPMKANTRQKHLDMEALTRLIAEYDAFMQELGTDVARIYTKKAEDANSELEPLARGSPDGRPWTARATADELEQWPAFLAFAGKTILDFPAAALVAASSKLQGALREFGIVSAVFDIKNDGREETWKKTLGTAKVTEVTALFLTVFAVKADPVGTRRGIMPVITKMQADRVDHTDLPPVLWQAIGNAKRFKKP